MILLLCMCDIGRNRSVGIVSVLCRCVGRLSRDGRSCFIRMGWMVQGHTLRLLMCPVTFIFFSYIINNIIISYIYLHELYILAWGGGAGARFSF